MDIRSCRTPSKISAIFFDCECFDDELKLSSDGVRHDFRGPVTPSGPH
jgi:hypothetical protein